MSYENVQFYDDFAMFYDAIHGSTRGPEFGFYTSRIGVDDSVLEVACGSGTLTHAIAEKTSDIVGIDASGKMLDRARALLPDLVFKKADMRDFDIGRTFSRVICPLNSLLHLESDEDVIATLACMARHTAPSGKMIVDIFNAPSGCESLEIERHQRAEFEHGRTGKGVACFERSSYDSEINRMTVEWMIEERETGNHVATSTFTMRPIPNARLAALFATANCEVVEVFGDYEGGPWSLGSKYQVVVATPLT